MKITSLDIRKQEFARSFRGYDMEEVDSFLQVVATGWQEMVDDLRRSGDKIQDQQLKLDHYMKVEEALEEALQTARTSARQTVESAEKKATDMLENAENRVVDLQKNADSNRLHVKRETARYAVRQKEIVAKLRAFLVSEMEILHHFETESGEASLISTTPKKEIELVKEEVKSPEAALTGGIAAKNEASDEAKTETPEGNDTDAGDLDAQLVEEELSDPDEDVEEYELTDEHGFEDEDESAADEQEGDDNDERAHESDASSSEESNGEPDNGSPSWRVTPVFESVEDADNQEAEDSGADLAVNPDAEGGEDSADEEIKKIHEILKGLDDEHDGEGS